MKNNITYYIHYADSDTHPKFKMLRVKYGWAGEGKFWALNNKIAEAENCELNLSKKYNKASLANDLNFTLEEFDEFLEYLEKDCDLVIRKNNHITTEIVRKILIRVMKERKRNKENYESRIIQDVNKGTTQSKHVESKIKHVESIQRKVKESKLKKEQFLELWNKYPNKDGRTKAEIAFNKHIKTKEDWLAINTALANYLNSDRVKNGYVKNGSTWFNNWRDWVDYVEPNKPQQAKENRPDYLDNRIG